jgi:hypothetical protein
MSFALFLSLILVFSSGSSASAVTPGRELRLNPGENVVTSLVVDSSQDVAYLATAESDFRFSLEDTAARVIKVKLPALRRVESAPLAAGESPVGAMVLVPSLDALYLGIYGDPNRDISGRIVSVRARDLKRIAAISLGKNEYGISAATWNSRAPFALFGTLFGTIVGVDLSPLSGAGSLSLQKEDSAFQCGCVDPSGTFAYFGTSTGNIMKVEVKEISPAGNLTALRGNDGFRFALMEGDGRYSYFVTGGQPARVVRIDLAQFRLDKVLTLPEEFGKVEAALLDRRSHTLLVIGGGVSYKVGRIGLGTFHYLGDRLIPLRVRVRSAALDRSGALLIGYNGEPGGLLRMPLD